MTSHEIGHRAQGENWVSGVNVIIDQSPILVGEQVMVFWRGLGGV